MAAKVITAANVPDSDRRNGLVAVGVIVFMWLYFLVVN
jgi:hypothetical protein